VIDDMPSINPTNEDQSNPFLVASPTGIMNALLKLNETVGRLTQAVTMLDDIVKDLRHERTQWVTRDELHEHAQQCPGNPRGVHIRRPPSGQIRAAWWTALQQRLGVIISICTLVGLLGGAWWWTASTWATVQRQLEATEKKQAKRDKEIKHEVKTVMKAVEKIQPDAGELQ